MKNNDHIENDIFKPEDDTEKKRLEFFWKQCLPEESESVVVSIREKTFRKIKEMPEEQSTDVIKKRSLKTFYISVASVAASFVILAMGTWWFRDTQQENIRQVVALMEPFSSDEAEDITLVMSESEKLQLNTDAQIAYTSKGAVSVNSESVLSGKEGKKEKESSFKEQYNQLIVPKGKRSQLQLSDGTKMWVNSGTKVIYPRVFSGSKREIYVEGEVFLEVTHDADRPFYVNTSGFEVKVLGTSFDVFAYKQIPICRVVLAEGSVEIKDQHNGYIRMEPDELVSIEENNIKEKVKVNAVDYKAWIEGLMILNGDYLNILVERLSLLYGTKIVCEPSLGNEQIYGKLDLRENLNEILDYIESMIPISAREENGVIYLNKRE